MNKCINKRDYRKIAEILGPFQTKTVKYSDAVIILKGKQINK